MSSMRGFYNYLKREKVIKNSPVTDIDSPKIVHALFEILTKEEIHKLISAPDTSDDTGIRDRMILEILYGTGMRATELINLKLTDLFKQDNQIRVTGKGSKTRVVLLHDEGWKWIDKYLSGPRERLLESKHGNANLVVKNPSKPFTRQDLWAVLKKYSGWAGLNRRVYPHILRHSYATHMLEGGADLRALQELLGHEDLATTEVYTSILEEHKKQVFAESHPRA